jgi:pilus assembly protein CpaB
MSSSALKAVAVIAVLLAVILAAVGYNYSRSFAEKAERAERAEQERREAKQALAVVAIKPLTAYKPIGGDDVALVPVAVLPAQHYTSIDEVINKVPLVDIDAGAPVTGRYFAESNILARAIPAGFQAVSVEVNDVVAVGGFLRPGDVVDVLLYLRETGDEVTQPQSRVLLEDIRVLAYHERIIDRPEGVEAEGEREKQRSRLRTAVLAVAEADTTKLVLGSNAGEIRLALHGQREAIESETPATTAAGLPLAQAAVVNKNPEKSIGLSELAGIKGRSPGAARAASAAPAARAPTVEIVRGSKLEAAAAQ